MKIRDNINISNKTKCNNNKISYSIVHFKQYNHDDSNYLNDIKKSFTVVKNK